MKARKWKERPTGFKAERQGSIEEFAAVLRRRRVRREAQKREIEAVERMDDLLRQVMDFGRNPWAH